MQSDRQERISERAYQIWVAEGRVHGKDHEHWQRAEREIAQEELKVAAELANRATGAAATTRAAPATQATENRPTPAQRKSARVAFTTRAPPW